MVVGLLSMLFLVITAYMVLARFDRQIQAASQEGDKVTQSIAALEDLASSLIRGPSGADMVTGRNYTHLPGYWEGAYIAGPLAVIEPNAVYPGGINPNNLAASVRFPSSLTKRVRPVTLFPLNAASYALLYQIPFLDAAGTGVPDSSFYGSQTAIELVNAINGRSVRASFELTPGDPNTTAVELALWQQFAEQARYAPAVRVQPHGGMIQLGFPQSSTLPWNADFMSRMFRWVTHRRDAGVLNFRADVNARELAYELSAQAAAIEPVLRRRLGLLDTERGTLLGALPPPLARLESLFTWTMHPAYAGKADSWQRFRFEPNSTEVAAWRSAVYLDPNAYNALYDRNFMSSGADPRDAFALRQLVTTANYSDELARIHTQTAPRWAGLQPGALKYYLGKITDTSLVGAPLGVPRGAFIYDGLIDAWRFNDARDYDTPAGSPDPNVPQGRVVINELTHYFYELLAPYKWRNASDPNSHESLTQYQQAVMLAMNVVGAATPKAPNATNTGVHYDTVYYRDPNDPNVAYFAYTPQPFLTRVLAINVRNDPNGDPNDPNNTAKDDPNNYHREVAIELYNPNDSRDPNDPSLMVHNLDLWYFGISVSTDPNAAGAIYPLRQAMPAAPPLAGRSYSVLYVLDPNTMSTSWLARNTDANNPNPSVIPKRIKYDDPNSDPYLTVRLWKLRDDTAQPFPFGPTSRTDNEMAYVVDEMTLTMRDPRTRTGIDPNSEGSVVAWRSTANEPFLGAMNGRPVSWRMLIAANPDPNDPNNVSSLYHSRGPTSLLDPNEVNEFGNNNSLEFAGGGGVGATDPSIPLYTLNANLVGANNWPNKLWLHGTWRPAAFPTVGFLAYVPRFAHRLDASGRFIPMTVALHKQWQSSNLTVTSTPTDFGHMPIFDNEQDLKSGSEYARPADPNVGPAEIGRVPWGQLVFDYFTTIDPADPNFPVDPYRVPGRININNADWFVLSRLPMFGPTNPTALNTVQNELPFKSPGAAPAFWSGRSGVLVGTDVAGVGRYTHVNDPNQFRGNGWPSATAPPADRGQWYRVGARLGQAIAEYRDRVPYLGRNDPNYQQFGAAYTRNPENVVSAGLSAPYRDAKHAEIRGQNDLQGGSTPVRTGFLSLGELANVHGFDSEALNPNSSRPPFALRQIYTQDYMRAASALALLDTHFLTTRSNTFTIYTTLHDLENPQASVRSQVTVDRSNLLPRAVWLDVNRNGIQDANDSYSVLQNNGDPAMIGKREISYFNALYDE
jgi:hypothetical protein